VAGDFDPAAAKHLIATVFRAARRRAQAPPIEAPAVTARARQDRPGRQGAAPACLLGLGPRADAHPEFPGARPPRGDPRRGRGAAAHRGARPRRPHRTDCRRQATRRRSPASFPLTPRPVTVTVGICVGSVVDVTVAVARVLPGSLRPRYRPLGSAREGVGTAHHRLSLLCGTYNTEEAPGAAELSRALAKQTSPTPSPR